MIDEWLRPVEQIVLSTHKDKHRVVGFTSAEPRSGVSALATMCASINARSGFKTLLLDLSQPVHDVDPAPGWGSGSDDPRPHIIKHVLGFDMLVAQPNRMRQFTFNNSSILQGCLKDRLSDYASVVVDLPAVLDPRTDIINPVASAAACDAVILVCVRGKLTTSRLSAALELIRAGDVKLSGTVLNELGYTTAGVEIARLVGRWFSFAPRLSHWLQTRALTSELLN